MAVSLNTGSPGTFSKVSITSGVATGTATLSIGTGTNIALVVGIVTNGNTGITSCVWDAAGANQTMTQIASEQENTFVRFAYLFGLRNPATGNKTITVTTNATDTIDVCGIAFNGVEQSSDANAFKNAAGVNGGSNPSISVTTIANDATCACIISNGGALTITSGTQWWNDTNLSGHYSAGGYTVPSSGTSDTFSWTQGFADVWGAAGIHVVAASSGTTYTVNLNAFN